MNIVSIMLMIGRRLVVVAVGLGILALALWTLAGLVDLLPQAPLRVPALAIFLDPWASGDVFLLSWVASTGAVMGLALTALGLFVPGGGREHRFVLSASSSGNITLSNSSVHGLVQHAGEQVQGVRRLEASARLGRRGWKVRCDTSLWLDAPAHEVGGSLRETIARTLEAHTGLPVQRVEVALAYETPAAHQAPR
ncbi:MAG: alkaline shock response membrane anchor protein AmaP [Pseudomonadota bacterium]